MKNQAIRNLFATEIPESTEILKFKKPKEKANTRGIGFEDAGLNPFAYHLRIAL